MLQVLGQVEDTTISFQIYYQRLNKKPMTHQQTRYIMEASNHVRIDVIPKPEYYERVRRTLGIFTGVTGKGMAFFVKTHDLESALSWLDSAIPDGNELGSGERFPFHIAVNSLISYGGADNTLKHVFGASIDDILEENPIVTDVDEVRQRSKSVDLSGLYPVHKRIEQLRGECFPRRLVSEFISRVKYV